MAVFSETQICNNALLRLGADTVMNLDTDGTVSSIIASNLYAVTRDSLLRQHTWNFATVRTALAADVTAPAFEWLYQYQLPADFIRVVAIYAQSSSYKMEGQILLSNQGAPLYLKYVAQITDVTKFEPLFVDALTLAIAIKMGPRICGDGWNTQQGPGMSFVKELDDVLLEAKMVDSQDETPDELLITTFQDSRYGGWWGQQTALGWTS
jgi:hypothetical protein